MSESGTEPPSRGLFLPNGKPILSTPSPEQIAEINAHPRAEYFSTLRPNPEVVANWTTHFGLHRVPGLLNPFIKRGRYYFGKHVLNPLWEKIDSEFGLEPENMAVRGTAVALGSPVKTRTRGEVRSLSQILNEGSDTGSNRTRLAALSPSVTSESPILYNRAHSGNYLDTWAWLFRQDVGKEGDEKLIYPAMLVYDTRNMVINYGDVTLPDDPKLRQDVIVKAYILDHLHSENTKKLT